MKYKIVAILVIFLFMFSLVSKVSNASLGDFINDMIDAIEDKLPSLAKVIEMIFEAVYKLAKSVLSLVKVMFRGVGEKDVHFSVGRIYGFTTSDVSAYVARDLFYDQLPKGKSAMVIAPGDNRYFEGVAGIKWVVKLAFEDAADWDDNKKMFSPVWECYGWSECEDKENEIKNKYDKTDIILYYDHGKPEGMVIGVEGSDMIYRKMKLKPSVILTGACSMAEHKYTTKLFSIQNIRRGAMAVHAAVGENYNHYYFDRLLKAYKYSIPIGDAFREAKNSDRCGNIKGFGLVDFNYILIGDPTFVP